MRDMLSSTMQKCSRWTHSDHRAPNESHQRAHNILRLWELVEIEEELKYGGYFTDQYDDRHQYNGAQKVTVPWQGESAAIYNAETLLDYYGVNWGNGWAGNAKADADQRYGCAIEEDSDDEAYGYQWTG